MQIKAEIKNYGIEGRYFCRFSGADGKGGSVGGTFVGESENGLRAKLKSRFPEAEIQYREADKVVQMDKYRW